MIEAWIERRHSCVVYEHVDLSESVMDHGSEGFAVGPAADVGRYWDGFDLIFIADFFGELLTRYGPSLYRSVLLPRLGSEAAAEDARAAVL